MDTAERNPDEGAAKRRVNSTIVAAGVAFGLTSAGLGVAAAQTDTTAGPTTTTAAGSTDTTAAEALASTDATAAPATTDSAPATPATPSQSATGSSGSGGSGHSTTDAERPARTAETELTGVVAEKVKAAAMAAVTGGTITRSRPTPTACPTRPTSASPTAPRWS